MREIFTEIKRILKPGGIISAIVDYSDHYAHTDRNIGLLNYLRFTPEAWSKYNHSSHFQNRLRHHDYREMFEDLGFEIDVDEPRFEVEKPDAIADCFDSENPTVHATSGVFVLRVTKLDDS